MTSKKERSTLNGVKEIARRAKVSLATVDRVIHNRTGVAEKTRLKVNKIIADLDYQPNIFARQLASRKKIEFAVLIPRVSEATSYWKAPLEGVLQAEKELMPFGIMIKTYLFDQEDRKDFSKKAENLLKDKPAGILLAPLFYKESMAFVQSCHVTGIPCVFIDSDIPGLDRLGYIGPDLFQSGLLAGHLIRYGIPEKATVLVINISPDLNVAKSSAGQHRLLRKEEGLRTYFDRHGLKNRILKIDCQTADYPSIRLRLDAIFSTHADIGAVYVTNSRVSTIAPFFEGYTTRRPLILGFDFTDANINCLEKGTIDFVICDKPREQGYRGIMLLHQSQVLALPVARIQYLPIDIITKENYMYYRI